MTTFAKAFLTVGLAAIAAGPASAQQGRGGMMGGGGGAMLLVNKGVQKELKLTDEQAEKAETFAREYGAKMREQFQGLADLSEDERRTKMQEFNKARTEALQKGLAEIMKPEQQKRFDQIDLQASGPNAFATPKVVEGLKITDEQKAKIRQVNEDLRQTMTDAREDFQNDREGAMKQMLEGRKAASEKVMALLTAEQKSSWKEMVGEPFEVKYERRPQN